MFTLQNFENQADETILQRGKQYFDRQAITSLEEAGENIWQAEVEGTDTYQVEVNLRKNGQISDYFCDCPYDGEICKHVVAVLYALRQETKPSSGKRQKARIARNVFEHLVQTLSLAELQDFLRHYAAKSKDFRIAFELFFADKDARIDSAKLYGDLVGKIVRKYSNRGFIDYRATFGLTKEISKILANGQAFIRQNNFRDAFTLARVVLQAMMEAATQADDSAGNIGSSLSEAVELIDTIAKDRQVAPDLKEEVFTYLKNELGRKLYYDYGDFGNELFGIFYDLALRLHKAADFLDLIASLLPNFKGPYDQYQKEFFIKQKMKFLAATGKTEEAEQLVQEHLDIVEVRQREVDKAIARKDYLTARKLIADGIRIAQEKKHPGTVSGWQKQLLRLAVLEKDTAAIRQYARKLAFDPWFNREYYRQWKATFSEAEWETAIGQFIAETTARITQIWNSQKSQLLRLPAPPLLNSLGPVLIEEQDWYQLLELVQKENRLMTLSNYHPYLAPRFPAEMLQLYLAALKQYGQQADNRTDYAHLVEYMQMVMQDIPQSKEPIKALARDLQQQFPRRRAMLQELNKVLN